MTDNELKLLLDHLEIPQLRRDFTDILHLRWLERNLWIVNKGANVSLALAEIKKRIKEHEEGNKG